MRVLVGLVVLRLDVDAQKSRRWSVLQPRGSGRSVSCNTGFVLEIWGVYKRSISSVLCVIVLVLRWEYLR